jgi:hypothetical protein
MRTLPSHIRRLRVPSFVCATCIATALVAYTSASENFLRGQTKTSEPSAAPQEVSKTGSPKYVRASSDQPLWRVDLHSIGYPPENHLLQWQRGLGSFDTVDFLSDNVVAESFVTQEPAANLQRRGDPNRARPYRLHAIFMDANSGAVLKTFEWLGDDLKMGIFPRYDGSFVFFSTEHLVFYSSNWQPAKEAALLQLQEPGAELKEIAESPSGKFLAVRIRKLNSLLCLRIQTDTLTAERDTCSALLPFAISDDGMASTLTPDAVHFNGENRDAQPDEIHLNNAIKMKRTTIETVEFVGERGDLKKTLCYTRTTSSCGSPAFITNNMMVIHRQDDLGLLDITDVAKGGEARVQFQKEIGTHYWNLEHTSATGEWIATLGRPVRTSANGERFAVAMNAAQSPVNRSTAYALFPEALPAIDPTHVDVYDLPSGLEKLIPTRQCYLDAQCDWWIYKLTNVKHQFQHIWGFGLSPNGEKLVIDSGGVIHMYALPPATHLNAPAK